MVTKRKCVTGVVILLLSFNASYEALEVKPHFAHVCEYKNSCICCLGNKTCDEKIMKKNSDHCPGFNTQHKSWKCSLSVFENKNDLEFPLVNQEKTSFLSLSFKLFVFHDRTAALQSRKKKLLLNASACRIITTTKTMRLNGVFTLGTPTETFKDIFT